MLMCLQYSSTDRSWQTTRLHERTSWPSQSMGWRTTRLHERTSWPSQSMGWRKTRLHERTSWPSQSMGSFDNTAKTSLLCAASLTFGELGTLANFKRRHTLTPSPQATNEHHLHNCAFDHGGGTHAQTHTRTSSCMQASMHAHTPLKHARTHAHARALALVHARTHARALVHACTHSSTCVYACSVRMHVHQCHRAQH